MASLCALRSHYRDTLCGDHVPPRDILLRCPDNQRLSADNCCLLSLKLRVSSQ